MFNTQIPAHKAKGHDKIFEGIEFVYFLIVMMVSWVCAYIQTVWVEFICVSYTFLKLEKEMKPSYNP